MNIYFSSNSIFHYMHGFTKLWIFGLFFTIFPFMLGRLESLAILLMFFALLMLYLRIPLRKAVLMVPVLILSLVLGLTYVFADMGGTVYAEWDVWLLTLRVTSENALYAARFFLRMLNWSFAFFLLLFTTRPQDLVYGLKTFRVPDFLTLSLSLTMRFWSIMLADVKAIMDAQYCRGVDFRHGHPAQRMFRFAGILIPVIFVLLKRFRTTSFALALKGVGLKNKRTDYYHPKLSAVDYWGLRALAVAAVPLIGCAIWFGW